MLRRMTLLAGGVVLLGALPVWAQDSLEGQLCGRGIHAYYAGDLAKAHELLTAAIETDAKDPRAYYFRGLVYLRYGRPEESQADFEKGAAIEVSDSGAFYDVSQALQRVQGRARLVIEQYRTDARLAALKKSKAIHRARYEALRGEEDRVLRKDVVLTPESPFEEKPAVAESAPAVAAPTDDNPFAAPAAAPAVEKSSQSSAPAVPAAATPTEAASADAAKVSGGLLGKLGKAFGQTLGEQVEGVTKGAGNVMPGAAPMPGMTPPGPAMPPTPPAPTPPAPAAVPPAPTAVPPAATAPAAQGPVGGTPAPGALAPAATPPAAVPPPASPAATPSTTPPASGDTEENPFETSQRKRAGIGDETVERSPVTKPATKVRPVSDAPPLVRPVSAKPADRSRAKTSGAESKAPEKDSPASRPSEGNPFVEEP